jgi:hypothetical protein
MKILFTLAALAVVGTAMADDGKPNRIERGAQAVEKGVKKTAERTGNAIERGAKATERGVKRTVDRTEKKVKKVLE